MATSYAVHSTFDDPVANPGLVHIHIGKTSGTSLEASLTSALGEGVCSPPFVQSFMNLEDAKFYDSFPIIHGHISRRDQLKWFPKRKIITILRNPIERGLSFIRYVRSLPSTSCQIAADAKVMPPLELMDTHEAITNLNNTMVRQLGGHILDLECDQALMFRRAQSTLSEAMWVGCQFDMDRSLKELSQLLGRSIKPSLTNITPASIDGLEDESAVVKKLENYNILDLRLWRWTKKHIWKCCF